MLSYLEGISLKKLVEKQHLITLKDTTTVGEALDLFKRKGIQSAPIKNSSRKSSQNQILGLVGVIDIVYYVLSLVPKMEHLTPSELKKMFITNELVDETSVYNIINKSQLNSLVELYETDTALKLFMSVLKKGVHRIILVNGENEAVHTLSRTDVIRILQKGIANGDLNALRHVTIRNIIQKNDKIVSIDSKHNILECLTLLKRSGHKSIPVVNDNKEIVGNFSASDIYRLEQDLFIEFHVPVSEYATNDPIYLKMDDTLETVVNTMVHSDLKNTIHCIWVVDDQKHIIGSITMTDVLRFVAKNEQKNNEKNQ